MAELNSPKVSKGVHPGSVDPSAHDAGAPSATLNRENVAKVRDVIAALNPERFDMGTLGPGVQPLLHDCETAACISGWCATLIDPETHDYIDTGRTGCWLGLDHDAKEELFFMFSPSDGSNEATQAHAVAVLDILLETGRVDWDAAFERVAIQAHAVAK